MMNKTTTTKTNTTNPPTQLALLRVDHRLVQFEYQHLDHDWIALRPIGDGGEAPAWLTRDLPAGHHVADADFRRLVNQFKSFRVLAIEFVSRRVANLDIEI